MLGGCFTTIEGVLKQVYEELSEKVFTDSVDKGNNAFVDFLMKLKKVWESYIIPYTPDLFHCHGCPG